jgi:peptide deformylase
MRKKREILTHPHPTLGQRCSDVQGLKVGSNPKSLFWKIEHLIRSRTESDVDSGYLRSLAIEMGYLMGKHSGLGLSAPQVGAPLRAFIDFDLTFFINPVVRYRSESTNRLQEGCLSIPGVQVEVERPDAVRIRATDLDGNPFTGKSEYPLQARVWMHEMDHLDGILITDRRCPPC